jgi:2-polyprenyl-3-methyl-5-hydroxy-6-metoxy-1,4-benzoquinol methylase
MVAAMYDAVFEGYLPHKAGFWERVGTAPLQATIDAVLDRHSDAECLKIVDVGCGTGVEMAGFPEWLQAQGCDGEVECIGCDVSERTVKHCREDKGLNWSATVERRLNDDSYTYCWMLARKPE